MRAFDASSIVYGWDNYPIAQFPPLWDWIAAQIQNQNIVMSDVALTETNHVAPECAAWLRDIPIHLLQTTPEILDRANRIKIELGIFDDQFHPEGVDENDLIIIAGAAVEGIPLVSNEALQNNKPRNPVKYKIPAVCEMTTVSVDCQDFLEFIKHTGHVFR